MVVDLASYIIPSYTSSYDTLKIPTFASPVTLFGWIISLFRNQYEANAILIDLWVESLEKKIDDGDCKNINKIHAHARPQDPKYIRAKSRHFHETYRRTAICILEKEIMYAVGNYLQTHYSVTRECYVVSVLCYIVLLKDYLLCAQ